MEFYKDNFDFPRAKKSFKVIIVGAGIAGLSVAIALRKAGHDVLILEQVPEIGEVGAGIQMAPNAARILGRLGLLEKIMEKSNLLTKSSLRRWQNNKELGAAPLMPVMGERYDAPLSVIHRADLQNILIQAVRDHQIPIQLNARVVDADPDFAARVKLEDGTWIAGDVIIAGDGVKSHIRSKILARHGRSDKAIPTGDAAYRLNIPREKLQHNEYALSLLNSNVGMRWMGPGGHIMAYPIKNNSVYNMVLLHPEKPNAGTEECWTTKGDKKEMMDFYKDWCPEVRDLLSYVPDGDVMEWTLNTHEILPTWRENRVVLIGDACHPMLPYVAQGAAQAIEDAAVLTCVLSMIDDEEHIDMALEIYELVRKHRGEAIQQSAATTRNALHLPDGPAQILRDEAMAGKGKNPDLWADREWQDFMWGIDVMKEVLDNWDELIEKTGGPHLTAVHVKEEELEIEAHAKL